MLSNVTDSRFYPECNTERGFIDQLYIELGFDVLIHLKRNVRRNGIIIKQANVVSFSGEKKFERTLITKKSPRLFSY